MKTTTRAVRHAYQEDPDLPGTCRCGRPDPHRTNQVHKLPDLTEEARESRRRAGEGDDE
jgi:hypothetical protein